MYYTEEIVSQPRVISAYHLSYGSGDIYSVYWNPVTGESTLVLAVKAEFPTLVRGPYCNHTILCSKSSNSSWIPTAEALRPSLQVWMGQGRW